MPARKRILLLASAAALGGMMGSRWTEDGPAQRARAASARIATNDTRRTADAARGEPKIPGAEPALAPAPTRRDAAELVRTLYRTEQLTRELDLEQRRYGRTYWSSECSGPELAKLQQAKEAMLAQLGVEANQVLRDLFPDEAGEPITLTAIFDADHAGPNITFLSPSLRERFESEMLAGDDSRGVDRERLLAIATHALPPGEMESYRQWNDRPDAALRSQLVGFNPTEIEFAAILQERNLAADDGEVHGADGGLEMQLGAVRYADFLKLNDPAMHTALHDLQRNGLSLGEADWLAATRTRAVADIGETWQSLALTDAMKRDRVAQIERAYGQAIAARLALPEASLDGLTPGS